ncbi:MAG TPA: DUF480 domain-containing protein [Planctomycetaceae bacterium]|jgi:hypothetical protein
MSHILQQPLQPPITSLTPAQRRVLGTMIEKALTVPESYPLTLKALTTGCNQKSARHPLTNYTEYEVEDTLNSLREMGLAAVVHTELGRTERFRHYVRKRFSSLSEPQVAILGELLLRGRQPIGDLRSRAGRLAPDGSLDSLEQLRAELSGLAAVKLIQSDGPLEMRGVDIDHNLYQAKEAKRMTMRSVTEEEPLHAPPSEGAPAASVAPSHAANEEETTAGTGGIAGRLTALETTCAALQAENTELRETVAKLREAVEYLRHVLGG